MCKTNKSKFLAGWIKGIILGTQLLFFQNLGLIDKLLLEHVGLPHILDLAEGAIEVSFEVPHEVPSEVSHEVPLK